MGLTNVLAVSTKNDPGDGLALIGDGPPVLTAPLFNFIRNQDTFSVSLPTLSGRVYALEFKDSLGGGNWIALPLVAGFGGAITLTDPFANSGQRFYRVRQW